MNRAFLQKFISLLMVAVILAISSPGFCQSAHSTEASCAAISQGHDNSYLSAAEKQCPDCPVNDHSIPDHCDSCCYCSCHAPLTVQPLQIICSQLITPLEFHEPFKTIPEVYLSKFIPPHILV